MDVNIGEALVASALGSAAFPVVLAAGQTFVFAPLRLTSGRGIVASLVGFVSVVTAGTFASLSTVASLKAANRLNSTRIASPTISLRFSQVTTDIALFGAGSIATFLLFGGRFRAVLPSDLFRPGSFARQSIAAPKGHEYATRVEKEAVQAIGKRHGCHSCGRRAARYVADHQPPSAVVERGGNALEQRFYPQCFDCSNRQGGSLAKGKGSVVVSHGMRLRLYHVWLPVPLIVGGVRGLYEKKEEEKEKVVVVAQTQVQSSLDERQPSDSAVKGKAPTVFSNDSLDDIEEGKDEVLVAVSVPIAESDGDETVLVEAKGEGTRGRHEALNELDLIHITVRLFSALAAAICYFSSN